MLYKFHFGLAILKAALTPSTSVAPDVVVDNGDDDRDQNNRQDPPH